MKRKLKSFLRLFRRNSESEPAKGLLGLNDGYETGPLTRFDQQVIPKYMADGINERFLENQLRQRRKKRED